MGVCYSWLTVGVWRSPVAHLHGVQGAVGSNPITPTRSTKIVPPALSAGGSALFLLLPWVCASTRGGMLVWSSGILGESKIVRMSTLFCSGRHTERHGDSGADWVIQVRSTR